MNKVIFVGFIFTWMVIAMIGLYNYNKPRVHWELIVFLLVVPFIPLVAKLCGLF